jgi:hypothetical protein
VFQGFFFEDLVLAGWVALRDGIFWEEQMGSQIPCSKEKNLDV